MKVLIIEDNNLKLEEIKHFFLEELPQWEIHDTQSYTAALRRIIKERWDLLILDMTLPNYDSDGTMYNDNMETMAGRLIINRMNHRGIIIPTIVITRFETFGIESIGLEDISRMLKEEFGNIWKGTVFYDETTEGWKEELKTVLIEQGLL